MKATDRHHNSALTIILLALVLFAGCQPAVDDGPDAVAEATAPPPTATPLAIPGAAPDVEDPSGVVETFYTAYLNAGEAFDFRESPYLSERLIGEIAAAREARYLGADPFLLAQQPPAAIRVETVVAAETTARVVLRQMLNLEPPDQPTHDLTIDLVREQGYWLIDTIQTGSPLTPDGVVQLFYNAYFGVAEGTEFSYGDNPYLSPAFIREVDALYTAGDNPAYDPFLRAVNRPAHFFVLRHEAEMAGERATVPVQLIYGRSTAIVTVSLHREEGQWRIAAVDGELPDDATAASQVVELFADSYFQQWYAYADEHDLPHTGAVDLAAFIVQNASYYQDSPYLTPAFVAAAQEMSGTANPEDPFFLRAGVPAQLEMESAWADGDRAEVRLLQRWLENNETRPMTVTLEQVDGHWRISGVVASDNAAAASAAPAAEMHPADVLRAFFAAYLQQGGYAGGAHVDNPVLAPGLVDTLEGDAAHYRTLGLPVDAVDPVLHTTAAVVPDGLTVEVGPVRIAENEQVAVARVERHFRASGVSLPLQVLLVSDGRRGWQIQEIHAVALENAMLADGSLRAEAWVAVHVDLYYQWALGYGDRPEALAQLPELLRFDFEADGGMTFCGDAWPAGYAIESVYLEPGAKRAALAMRTSEPNTWLTLMLQKRDWYWVVADQQCADSPTGRARAFYTHYLGHSSSPFAGRAYRAGDYLTTDLIQRLDELAGAGDAGTLTDPFIQSASAPHWFTVAGGPDANSVLVTLALQDGGAQTLLLRLVLVDGRWLISAVEDHAP